VLSLRLRARIISDNPVPGGGDDNDHDGKSTKPTDALPPKPKKSAGGRKKKVDIDSIPTSSQDNSNFSVQATASMTNGGDDLGTRNMVSTDAVGDTIADPASSSAASALSSKGKASKSETGAKKSGTRKSNKVPAGADKSNMKGIEPDKSTAGGLDLQSILQLGDADFDFSADSISGLLPNLDENLAELEANLGVLSDEFRLEGGPLSSIPGLDGLSDLDRELLDRLRFDDKDSSMEGIEDLTESQLQDALMELDGNDDFNIDRLMRFSSSADSKPTDLGMLKGNSRGKNKQGAATTAMGASRQEPKQAKAAASAKDEDRVSEEDSDSEEGGTSMGYAAEGDDEDDLMLDVIIPNENNSFELSDEDDNDEDDGDRDGVTLRAVTSVGEVKSAGGSLDLATDLLGNDEMGSDETGSVQAEQLSQSSSEPLPKNNVKKTGKMKNAKASDIENLSGEVCT